MKKLNPIIICGALTVLFSLPSILKIPTVMPFLESEVRAKAPKAIDKLRKEGIWMVNTDLKSITQDEKGTCFHFDHRYTPDNRQPKPENRTTCIQ